MQNGQNRIRSATAPLIRAGVMMANIPWNIMWTYTGMFDPGR